MSNQSESKDKKPESGISILELIIGFALVVAGLVMLLLNISVSSFGFYRFGRISSGPILVIILAFLIIWAIIKKSKFALILCGVDIVLIIVSVLLGTVFVFRHISVLSLILMIGMFAVGVGLVLRNIFYFSKKDKKDEQ